MAQLKYKRVLLKLSGEALAELQRQQEQLRAEASAPQEQLTIEQARKNKLNLFD